MLRFIGWLLLIASTFFLGMVGGVMLLLASAGDGHAVEPTEPAPPMDLSGYSVGIIYSTPTGTTVTLCDHSDVTSKPIVVKKRETAYGTQTLIVTSCQEA